MRSGSKWLWQKFELDPAHNFSTGEIEFGHLRRVPQAAPCAATIPRGDYCVGIRRGHQIAGAQIERLKGFSTRRIEQHDVIGKIVRDQQFVAACVGYYGESGRVWDSHMSGRFHAD